MVTRLGDPYLVSGTLTAQVAGTLTAAVSNVVTAEARGQVTAVGTVTAAISTVVTAESRGQVTAVGTLTAQVSNIVTAQVKIGVGANRDWATVNDATNPATTNTPWVAVVGEQGASGVGTLRTRLFNVSAVLLASASDIAGARTAADQVNRNHAGVVLHLNVYGTAATAVIGGVIVQAKHNDKYRTLTAWASSITTAGLFAYAIHPGAGAGSQYVGVCPVPLPMDWRAIVSGALDANASAAYQLDAHYVGYG